MPSVINENTQYVDDAGIPIVNGYIYIGVRNQDPTVLANQITIYSDRDLTTPLSNPQRTDAYGRAENKIFIPGRYSITVQDSASTQEYQDLDAGELPGTGVTQLTNTQGTNTVIADAVPTITALVDNQTYVFRAAGANTGAMTLQIDTTAAKSILKQHDVAMASGDIEANQTVMVVYNGTDDVYELISAPTTTSFTDVNVSNDLTVGNDIIVTGVVDGRDVATDGTKLDGISAGATVNETLTILDTPEVIGTAVTQGSWVTVNSTTLNTATATKAIIRIYSNQSELSATAITHNHYLRKTGSALAVGNQTRTGVETRNQSASGSLVINLVSESIVNLDASFDFDYQIVSSDGPSTTLDAVNIILIGYYA